MKVVIAPDSFKGTLTARQAAEAIADGWLAARPGDAVVLAPMSDGGDGLLDAVATGHDTWHEVEVAGPLGHPRDARFLLRPDGTAIVESAEACGLALVPPGQRNPLHTTTYGVGQLLDAAREAGATRILVGLGGSATVDGGAGALTGLGFRLTTQDGGGLKVGGGELQRVAAAAPGWAADWTGVSVELLSDVETVLADAPRLFGPQKGATPEDVALLERGLERWADVAERDLAGRDLAASAAADRLRDRPGTGAAGGLGFGLAAGLGARFRDGAAEVAELVGLPGLLAEADVVVVGEGALDATSLQGKTLGHVLGLARGASIACLAVVGRVYAEVDPAALGLDDVEAAAPSGPGEDPAEEITAAATRLAGRVRAEGR